MVCSLECTRDVQGKAFPHPVPGGRLLYPTSQCHHFLNILPEGSMCSCLELLFSPSPSIAAHSFTKDVAECPVRFKSPVSDRGGYP